MNNNEWLEKEREQERLDNERVQQEEREYGAELFMCSECKEWTDGENPCCGVGGWNGGDYVTVNEDQGLDKVGSQFADAVKKILE